MKTISILIIAAGIVCIFWQHYLEMKSKNTQDESAELDEEMTNKGIQ